MRPESDVKFNRTLLKSLDYNYVFSIMNFYH